jgi:hypothetical protein
MRQSDYISKSSLKNIPLNNVLEDIQRHADVVKSASQSESLEINNIDRCFSGPMYKEKIDACYMKMMVTYACAVQAGGDIERKARDKLERFYRLLHNDTTVGIEKFYTKAKKLGCKQKPALSNP